MALRIETAAVLDALLFNEEADIVPSRANGGVVARGFIGATVDENDGNDAATEERQRNDTIKELGAHLREVADTLERQDPATTVGAAEDLVGVVKNSTAPAELQEKFEKIAFKAIKHSTADTGATIAAAATVYCIGKKAMSKLGGDVALSNAIGTCMKKFLTLRYGTFFSRDQNTGQWTMDNPLMPMSSPPADSD